jgi:Kef-type K+ transport system membrane component KefB
MTTYLQLTLSLALIIASAKLAGYLSIRIGQPAVLGELLVGILLGPSVINLLHLSYFTDQHLPEVIHQLAEIGVLLLMFLAGLELHLSDLRHSSRVAGYAGTLGVIFPLIFGVAAGLAFSMNLDSAIFLGLILAATSVSISAQTLMELKLIRTRVGTGLLGAAVFDDILVILGISIFSALTQTSSESGFWRILMIFVRMVLYFGIASLIGWWLFPKISRRIHNQQISQGLIAFVFVTILLYGWFAETAGNMAAITGAFLAGVWFSRTSLKEKINNGISTLAYSIFVPIFFVNIGLSANVREFTWTSLIQLGILTIIAIIGKILGAGWGANLGGLSRLESLQLGVGMISRGEVGLIAAAIGVSGGYLEQSSFSAIVGVVIITTILTPILLRMLFKKETLLPESGRVSQEGAES